MEKICRVGQSRFLIQTLLSTASKSGSSNYLRMIPATTINPFSQPSRCPFHILITESAKIMFPFNATNKKNHRFLVSVNKKTSEHKQTDRLWEKAIDRSSEEHFHHPDVALNSNDFRINLDNIEMRIQNGTKFSTFFSGY